ncbi:MAG: C25 family cysteine peptidase [Planctomycetota bacterium]
MLKWMLLLGLLLPPAKVDRVLFVVPLGEQASWQDDAFLAAIPAACALGRGEPMVLAISEQGPWRPEVLDFISRYAPNQIYGIGVSEALLQNPAVASIKNLRAENATDAALAVSQLAWTQSAGVVFYDPQEVGSGLVASALAARLKQPLFPCRKGVFANSVRQRCQELKVQHGIFVGQGKAPKLGKLVIKRLKDAVAVTQWMRRNNLPVEYLAVVNPTLQRDERNQALALCAPLLAAGRNGVVVPLPTETRWKLRFDAESSKGLIQIGKRKTTFELGQQEATGKWWARIGKAKEKLHTGDVIKIGKTSWTVDVDADETARGQALWLTSPTTAEIQAELQRYIHAAKQPPQYLCLVGWPEAIPMAIIADGQGIDADLVSDLPYAQTDDDPFLEFAHARFLSTDMAAATLLACRGFARDDFADRSWERCFATAEWESSGRGSLEAAGFRFIGHHPGDAPIQKSSPLTQAGVIVHGSHAMWTVMGQTYAWNTSTLLAPAIVETAGCSTASLDQDVEHRSVAAQLLRNGAVAFVGNTRRGIAEQDLFRSEIWNALLSGSTLGEAQRKALNRTLVAVLEKDQSQGGAYFYQYYNHAVLGDPALQLHLQSTHPSASAHSEINGKRVTVFSPESWIRTAYAPLEEWGCKFSKLYSWRGAGVGVESTWYDPEKRNQEALLYTVEVHTRSKVDAVKPLEDTEAPLGWTGSCFIDYHADGSRTLYWRVRFIDFDMTSGEIKAQFKKLEFRLIQ